MPSIWLSLNDLAAGMLGPTTALPIGRELRKTMIQTLLRYVAAAFDFLFGCHHSNLSRVFTISGRSYRVCCECGAQFGYSLQTMSIQRRALSSQPPAHVMILKSAH